MTNRMKKTTFVIGAVLVLALVFAMAFALVPSSTPTAYAAANVIEWTKEDMANFGGSMGEGESREMKGITLTIYSGGSYDASINEGWSEELQEYVREFDYCSISGYGDEKSVTFSIGNGRKISKIEFMGDGVSAYLSGEGWDGCTWKGEASEVILKGYVDYVNWICFTLVPIQSAVTLNTNGGTVNSGNITGYSEGIGATLPTDLTKEGDTFRGWYTNPLFFGDPVVAISNEETGAKTYWAKWDGLYDYSETIETDKRQTAYSGERLSVSAKNAGDDDGAAIIRDTNITVSTTNGGKIDSVALVLTYNQDRAGMVTSNKGTRDAIFSYGGATYVVFKDIDSISVSFGTNNTWVYVRRIIVNYNDPILSDVTLHTNGGNINNGNITQYAEGTVVTLPTDVTREGYAFKGWYDNEQLNGNAVASITGDATGNKEFWAKWYRPINYNLNGGNINSGNVTSYEEGVGATLPTNVTKQGSNFAGWYDNATFDGDAVTTIGTDATGVKTYWAKWTGAVTLHISGGTINSGNVTAYVEGVGATLPIDVTNGDLIFAGWYDNATFDGEAVTTIGTDATGAKTYWSKWIGAVTLYINGGTIGSGNLTQYVKTIGATLPADVTREEYVFAGWYANAEFDGEAVDAIGTDATGNKEYWAKWNPIITYNNLNGGAINGDYATYYVEGVGVSLPADVTREGCTFLGWYDNAELDGEAVTEIGTEVTAPKTYWAKWSGDVVYHLDGGAIKSGNVASYVEGEGATLPTDVTKAGGIFLGWYDNAELDGEAVTEIGTDAKGVKEYWAKWYYPPVPYVSRSWDEDNKVVVDTAESCVTYTVIESDVTSWTDGNWYVVAEDVTVGSRVGVSGTVNLILKDGATLTVNGGINVWQGNTLNIYGQTAGTGALTTNVTQDDIAGIGGSSSVSGGNVTIYGGTVRSKGGRFAAGIGGGWRGNGGNVTIYGGTVVATGADYGAGIGGGRQFSGPVYGGSVTIYGGNVTANGGARSAGIGGSDGGDGATVKIYGGAVVATGWYDAAAIGAGYYSTNHGTLTVGENMDVFGGSNEASAVYVTDNFHAYLYLSFRVHEHFYGDDIAEVSYYTCVCGLIDNDRKADYEVEAAEAAAVVDDLIDAIGEVEATKACKEKLLAAQAAYDSLGNGQKAFVVNYSVLTDAIETYREMVRVYYISRSWNGSDVVEATESCYDYTAVESDVISWTNGIWYVVTEDVTIDSRVSVSGTVNLIIRDGVTLTVNGGINVAKDNTLIIYGQTAGTGALNIANVADSCAGIGSRNWTHAGTIVIHDGTINSTGGKYSAGIGGCFGGDGATLTIYGGNVTATGNEYGAGIGGGWDGNGGTVTIYGGYVSATGGNDGAGIGGGSGGSDYNGGSVTIYGGYVSATGGDDGAGIGGGDHGNGANVTIYGGYVVARSVEPYAAAIGGGSSTSNPGTLTVEDGMDVQDSSDYNGCVKVVRGPVSYMVWNGIDFEKTTCDNFTVVETNTTSWTNGGWYVVYYDVTINSRIKASGTVNLILVDGATLTAKGIDGVATLNVYGQKNASSSIVIDSVDDGVAAISDLTIVGKLDVFAGNDEASAEYVTDYAQAYSYMAIKAHKHVCGNDINDVSYYTCRGCDGIDSDRKAVYDAVQEVKALIAAIGSVRYTPESAEKIEAARAAFENLTAEVQALVGALDTLTVAESTYATLKDVEDLIDAIGEVEYTAESKEKIEAARAAFDNLPEDFQALVLSAGTLTDAESTYDVKEVVAFIDNIGEVEYTEEVKAKIDAAKEKLDALTDEQKAQITNAETLANAESTYEVKEVIALIDNIGEVEYTEEIKAKIDAAKEKLDALTDKQKAQITNVETLATAESTYEVIETIAFINEIGEVAYDDDTRELIAKAREAYNKLSGEQKAQVGVVETLTQAEEDYTELAVEAISGLIDIAEVSLEDKEDVLSALAAFENLSPEEQNLVPQETINKLNAAVKEINDIETANAASDDIVDLPEIGELTFEDKDDVVAVRAAFDNLSPEAQAKISAEIKAKLEAAEKEIDDIETANEASDDIVDLPEIGELTLEDKDDVVAARAAYLSLTEYQRKKVSAEIKAKLEAAEREIADIETANGIHDEINSLPVIGDITLADKEEIEAAKKAFDELTPYQQEKVSAETVAKLTSALKKISDIETSNDASDDIADLPEIGELSLEDKEDVLAAKEAFEALSDEAKENIPAETVEKLEAAVKEIVDIEQSNETTETIIALPAVGDVEIEDEAAIEAARAAFEELSDEGKAKVSEETKAKLEAAEEVIADIKSIVVTKKEDTTTYAKEISEEAAETGVMVKQLFKKASNDETATKEVAIKAGDTSVVFDSAAVDAIGDKGTTFSMKVSEEAPVGAEMQIDLELKGATFEEGNAVVSTKYDKEIPAGKKLAVYYLFGGLRFKMNSWFKDGFLFFKTNHFSTYIVVLEDENVAGSNFDVGWISFIFGMLVLLYFAAFIVLTKVYGKDRKLLCLVGLAASAAVTLAAIVIVAVNPGVLSALSFGLCVVDALLFILYGTGGDENKSEKKAEKSR